MKVIIAAFHILEYLHDLTENLTCVNFPLFRDNYCWNLTLMARIGGKWMISISLALILWSFVLDSMFVLAHRSLKQEEDFNLFHSGAHGSNSNHLFIMFPVRFDSWHIVYQVNV